MRSISLLLLTIFHAGTAHFSTDFTQWLDKNHDIGKRQWIERSDLPGGSFGGRKFANETLLHNPVVFVHGVNRVVGEMMRDAANYYTLNHNYTDAELYGTTYETPNGDQTKWMKYTMKCEHVKQVRFLIEAVHNYTGRPVDVVAFSMGVPISRKAIMGGACVDSKEDIGPALTSKMNVYVGVAGPNKGVAPVIMGIPFPLCALSPLIPICNPDINYMSSYEGQRIYTIGSKRDEVVGHSVCFDVTTQISGQNAEKIYDNKKHDETFISSYDLQLSMLNYEPW